MMFVGGENKKGKIRWKDIDAYERRTYNVSSVLMGCDKTGIQSELNNKDGYVSNAIASILTVFVQTRNQSKNSCCCYRYRQGKSRWMDGWGYSYYYYFLSFQKIDCPGKNSWRKCEFYFLFDFVFFLPHISVDLLLLHPLCPILSLVVGPHTQYVCSIVQHSVFAVSTGQDETQWNTTRVGAIPPKKFKKHPGRFSIYLSFLFV